MKFQFLLNTDILHTDRTSYDLLDLTGDLGGVIEIFKILFTLCASGFAKFKIKAIFANQLVSISEKYKGQLFN
jgi:hypothetical protein